MTLRAPQSQTDHDGYCPLNQKQIFLFKTIEGNPDLKRNIGAMLPDQFRERAGEKNRCMLLDFTDENRLAHISGLYAAAVKTAEIMELPAWYLTTIQGNRKILSALNESGFEPAECEQIVTAYVTAYDQAVNSNEAQKIAKGKTDKFFYVYVSGVAFVVEEIALSPST